MAQNDLGGYVPPPLFGAQKEPPPKVDNGVPTLPSLSKPVIIDEKKAEEERPVKGKPNIILLTDEDEPETAPVKTAPVPKPKPAVKKTEPKPAPKKEEPKKEIPKIEKLKPTSEGVVKGPKTMPAVKKENVDSEITFEELSPPKTNMLDRAQKTEPEKEAESEEEIYVAPKSNPTILLPDITTQKDGSRKMVLLFQDKQSNLTKEQRYILASTIVKILRNNPYERLLIEAYASNQEEGLSTDRRLSLSRALAIRAFLLENKIESSRVDVRALGAETNAQPLDRVEFYLIP